MSQSNNIFKFPSLIEQKKEKMANIRDEIEKILTAYAVNEKDLWAVSLAAGRFASINLSKIDGEKDAIDFFKNCIQTQQKYELIRNSSNIT